VKVEVLVIDDERHVSLETAAALYEVEVVLEREVLELGLLGRAREHGGLVAIPVARLDRLAVAVRHARHGWPLEVLLG